MNKTLLKIGIILLTVIIIPALLFIAYEYSVLDENEKMIESIYTKQLDAILFSVNQYSQDIMESRIAAIGKIISEKNPDNSSLNNLLENNPFINAVLFTDAENNTVWNIYPAVFATDPLVKKIENILIDNPGLAEKLSAYKKAGYLKIEPLESETGKSLLAFITGMEDKNRIGLIIIDAEEFITGILTPRIQSVAGEEFDIFVYSDSVKYSINREIIFNPDNIELKKNLWLLPRYQLGISLKGETISGLVKRRTTMNLILISVLGIVLLAGVFIVFRYVRKEIEISQMKSDFVSNVSHELKTPLSMISMFSETLELDRVKNEEKKKEYLRIINQETNRLSRIVNSILSFSRIEAGRRSYNLVDTYLNDIVVQACSTFGHHLKEQGFKFQLITDENIPVQKLDEEAVSEAVVNLVDNAVKYSKNEKEVVVRTGKENNYSFVEVKDKGIGISLKDRRKIFDKFFRVSHGDIHDVKGTGLGLSIVKHIVDAHKGKIELESSPGKGSSFKLKFPLNSFK